MNESDIFLNIAWKIMDNEPLSNFEKELAIITKKYIKHEPSFRFLELAVSYPESAKKFFEETFGGWSFWNE